MSLRVEDSRTVSRAPKVKISRGPKVNQARLRAENFRAMMGIERWVPIFPNG